MKLLFTALILLGSLSVSARKHIISVSSNVYSPSQLTIQPGDTVRFQWVSGSHPTQSTSSPEAFPSFPMDLNNQVKEIAFNSTGSFPYKCIPHAHLGMTGVIIVSNTMSLPAFTREEVSIYPNPASDVVNIRHNYTDVDGVKLTNMIGQQVRFSRTNVASDGTLLLSVADLPKGIYFVNLISNGAVLYTKRLIKDR